MVVGVLVLAFAGVVHFGGGATSEQEKEDRRSRRKAGAAAFPPWVMNLVAAL